MQKHFSFDLWLTLIKSNPNFKKQRAKYFFNHFNFENNTIDFVEKVILKVDLLCNSINEKSGKQIPVEEMYKMIMDLMNPGSKNHNPIDVDKIYSDLESLFFEMHPDLYDENTLDVLYSLKAKGNSISILSNTAFIHGKSLRKLFEILKLNELFSFELFSDEMGYSKPSPVVFEYLIKKTHQLYNNNKVDIIHIGDNLNADVYGARAVGLNSFQINSNSSTIKSVLEL
jgi:putative hydrolase of the HAD superfamily